MMAFADDGDLITRFKGGDLSAFEDLVRKYQDRVYNLCRYMIQDTQDAQDAAQDVFLKAYGSLKAFKPDASLYTWLYRIAVNTCLDYKKKRALSRRRTSQSSMTWPQRMRPPSSAINQRR